MAQPLILADNLLDTTVLHPTHLVTCNRTPLAGAELYRLCDSLRDLTAFTIAETNVYLEINLDCGVPLPATMLVYDRGHNLTALLQAVQYSDDGSSYTTLVNTPLRATVGGTPSDHANGGCQTPEGVHWLTWAHATPHRYWRIYLNALGPGIAQRLTGLSLGLAYRFPTYLDAPFAPDRRETVHARNVRSEGGVRVKARPLTFRKPLVRLPVEDEAYPLFDAAVVPLLEYGQPWWWCVDDATAAGAGDLRLVQLEGDTVYDPAMDPVHREIDLALEEVIPRSRV